MPFRMCITIFFLIIGVLTQLAIAVGPGASKTTALCGQPGLENDSHLVDVISFESDSMLVDLRQADWQYLVAEPEWDTVKFRYNADNLKRDEQFAKAGYQSAIQAEGWKPIQLGRRWDNMGHAELNNKVTWLRLKFRVPAEMQGYKIGFFCTAVDEAANFFLNGKYLATRWYHWGMRVHEPVYVDLTPQIKTGGENLLVLRVSDWRQTRGAGVLGHVFLSRTLPYERTAQGGIDLKSEQDGPFSVVLHLGDALLANGKQIAFSAEQLRQMQIPPYILRDDELILVAPVETAVKAAGSYRVQLDQVSATLDASTLSVNCKEFPTQAERFELLTIPIELTGTYDNSFDPRQINVQMFVETPSGKTEKVPAFFYQDFTSVEIAQTEEILLPKKCDPWRLYYRPREIGTHKLHIIAEDKTGLCRTPDYKLQVTASDRRGFLRVSKTEPRFLEFDNGESYFGIGPSGWSRDKNYIFGGNTRCVSTIRLDEYYRKKAEAGSNFDYCLAEFFGRLYTEGGYIDQHVAWKCEHRLRTLESLGIYWVTCYDDLRRSTVYGLDTLPYSTAQGGPCKSIDELYVDGRALEMQRDHLRYFVARMSDSPSLMLWSIGDEYQDGARFSRLMVRSWVKELQNYVRTIDVYQHPHVMCEGSRSIAEGGDVILIGDWYFKKAIGAVPLTLELMQEYGKFNCPLINPEGGKVEWTKPADSYGPEKRSYYLSGERWQYPEAISFHNHLWISLFMKNAVGGTDWLGHFIVDKNQLFHATAIRNYLVGESLTKTRWLMTTPTVSDNNLRGFALQSEGKSLVWVWNRFYDWYQAGHQGNNPPIITNAEIAVAVNNNASYRVEYWDTRSGSILETKIINSEDLSVICPLPDIAKDIALKTILID